MSFQCLVAWAVGLLVVVVAVARGSEVAAIDNPVVLPIAMAQGAVLTGNLSLSSPTAAYSYHCDWGPNVNHLCMYLDYSSTHSATFTLLIGLNRVPSSLADMPSGVEILWSPEDGLVRWCVTSPESESNYTTLYIFNSTVGSQSAGVVSFSVTCNTVEIDMPWTSQVFTIVVLSLLALAFAVAFFGILCCGSSRTDITQVYLQGYKAYDGATAPPVPTMAYDGGMRGPTVPTSPTTIVAPGLMMGLGSDGAPPATQPMIRPAPAQAEQRPAKRDWCNCGGCCSSTSLDYPGYTYYGMYNHPFLCPDASCYWCTYMACSTRSHHHGTCCGNCRSDECGGCGSCNCGSGQVGSGCTCPDCGRCDCDCGRNCSCDCKGVDCGGGGDCGAAALVLVVIALVIAIILINVFLLVGVIATYRNMSKHESKTVPSGAAEATRSAREAYQTYVKYLLLASIFVIVTTVMCAWTFGVAMGLLCSMVYLPCICVAAIGIFSVDPSVFRTFYLLFNTLYWIPAFVLMNVAWFFIGMAVLHGLFHWSYAMTYSFFWRNATNLVAGAATLYASLPSIFGARAMRRTLRAQSGLPTSFDDTRGLPVALMVFVTLVIGISGYFVGYWIDYPNHPVSPVAAVFIGVGFGVVGLVAQFIILRPRADPDAPRPKTVVPLPVMPAMIMPQTSFVMPQEHGGLRTAMSNEKIVMGA